jgi:hypothetical protein
MAVVGGIISASPPSGFVCKVAYTATFVILGCAALVFVIRQSRDSAKAETELNNKVTELSASSKRAAALQALNNELQTKILDLAKTNAQLAHESISTVTGGDSFCYMDFNYQFGRPMPMFIHLGKYPLYDVGVRITDLNKLRKMVERKQQLTSSSHINLSVGELQVGKTWFNPNVFIPFSDGMAQDFSISFSARNGEWTEVLRLRKVGNDWCQALRVSFTPLGAIKPSEKPVFEKIAEQFPRNKDGLVDWNK